MLRPCCCRLLSKPNRRVAKCVSEGVSQHAILLPQVSTVECRRIVCLLLPQTYLDLSVMPSRARMRSATLADVSPLTALQQLLHVNLVGFGVADVTPLGGMRLTALEVGLNPLTSASLAAIGRISTLRHLELGGEAGRGGATGPGWMRHGGGCRSGVADSTHTPHATD